MDVICGIYKIENIVNGKVYIGQSVNIYNRWQNHKTKLKLNKHYNTYLQNAWNKYGENNFNFEIVEICDESALSDKEIYYIDYFDSFKNGYNLTTGGEGMGGYKHTEDFCNRMSIRFAGENNPMFGRIGSENPLFGKQKTEDQIQKMIKSRWTEDKRIENSLRVFGPNNPMYGKYGAENPESKAVVCLNTGEMFESISLAAKWCGLKSQQMIGQVCLGKRNFAGVHPDTGEKLRWKYAKDYVINQCEINEVAL